MAYAEFAPSPRLAPFVRCYWTSEDSAPAPHRVLPDGCVDVIFDRLDSENARFVGAMTTAISVPGMRPTSLVGVRFAPGAAAAFLDLPAREITDADLDVRHTWEGGRRLADELLGVADPFARIEAALLARLAATDGRIDAAVAACTQHIERAHGCLDLTALEVLSGWSARQLERRFAAAVGVGPKRFARIARFRAVLDRAPVVARGEWARVAMDLGYADQSHLLREVRALGGAPLAVLTRSPGGSTG